MHIVENLAYANNPVSTGDLPEEIDQVLVKIWVVVA